MGVDRFIAIVRIAGVAAPHRRAKVAGRPVPVKREPDEAQLGL